MVLTASYTMVNETLCNLSQQDSMTSTPPCNSLPLCIVSTVSLILLQLVNAPNDLNMNVVLKGHVNHICFLIPLVSVGSK
jgi:hypothetical protein